MKKVVSILVAFSALATVAATISVDTPEFALSIKHDGVRESDGNESLVYSPFWGEVTNGTVRITQAKDGAEASEIVSGLADEGTNLWKATQNGTYVLTHEVVTNGVVAESLSASFVVSGVEIPFPDGAVTLAGFSGKYDGEEKKATITSDILGLTVQWAVGAVGGGGLGQTALPFEDAMPCFTNAGSWQVWCAVGAPGYIPMTNSVVVSIAKREVALTSGSDEKAYDGVALTNWTYEVTGDGFVGDEGVTCSYTGSQTEAGTSANGFEYVFNDGTSEGNYTITKVAGTLTVTAAEIVNPFDPDDPTRPVTQEELAKANCVTNYDGDGHSIEVASLLNPLIAANNLVITYSLLRDGTYEAQNPVFTNVVSTSVWYRISADNFNSFTTNALLTISPRPVTITSGTKTDFVYDGQPHDHSVIIISENGFVAGEGITTSNWATVTTVAQGEVANTFEHAVLEGTTLSNYDITVVTGKIAVVKATYDMSGAAWNYAGPFTYDGTEKSVIVTNLPNGVAANYTDNKKTAVGDYTAKVTFEYDTENYNEPTAIADCAWVIEKASPTDNDPDPTDDPDHPLPPGAKSKFDFVGVYDGEYHTIDTNAMKDIAYTPAAELTIKYALTKNGDLLTEPSAFKDVVTTSFWYKIEAANYEDYWHEAKVTITNRPVTITSASGTWTYDGEAHATNEIEVVIGGDDAFDGTKKYSTETFELLNGETARNTFYKKCAEVGEVLNDFSIVWDGTAKETNYALTLVTGKLEIVSAAAVTVTITGRVNEVVYDGAEKSVSGYDVVSISNPLYSTADFRFDGIASTNGTNAGTYPMGLRASDFVNTNDNFSSVIFNITDGKLVISKAVNEWTTSPAIEGWTYGEAAKSPVGAAKFGTVSFSYEPMPVAAAGDYTMTVTVDGTANYAALSKTVQFTIAKATIPPSDDPDPVNPEVDPEDEDDVKDPEKKFSAFDYIGVYDGAAHTIKTNELVVAYEEKLGAVTVQYATTTNETAVGGGTPTLPTWSDTAISLTDVGAKCVWYKVSSANYADIIHAAKVVITNRPVTITSASDSWIYDGQSHSNVAVTAVGLVEGETITTNVTGTITNIGSIPNAFTYEFVAPAKESNYDVHSVTGKLEVVAIGAVTVHVKGNKASATYDGTEKSVSGWTFVSSSDALFTKECIKFTGVASLTKINAGTYPMGLDASMFSVIDEKSSAFPSVTFVIDDDGELKIEKKSPEGGSDDDPEKPDPLKPLPSGALSKFDFVGMYDGEYHTIDTNAMKDIAYTPAAELTFKYALNENGELSAEPFVYKGVVSTSFWYKIEAANFEDYWHEAKVTIINRPVTITSASGNWTYDGEEHSTNEIEVVIGGDDAYAGTKKYSTETFELLNGETARNTFYKKCAEVGEVPNNFSIVWDGTAKEANYALTLVTGKLEVVSAAAVTVTITGHVNEVVYNGTEKSVSGYDVVSISDPLYSMADFRFDGVASTNGTNAGTYPMGLKASDFVNTNSNFSSVIFNVTDGKLVITKATINGGNEPGGGSVPSGGKSKFDAAAEYDGKGHTIDGVTIKAAFDSAVVGGNSSVKFATDKNAVNWTDAAPVYTNAGEYVVWYKASAANYEDFSHEVKLTITKRDISEAVIAEIAPIEYADQAVTPVPTVTDGTPSIITTADYDVSYANNMKAGTATVTITGKRNYTGSKSVNFTIKEAAIKYASLKGELAWKLNLGTGCYTAQLKLTCTNGLATGISDLKFAYQDRTSGSKITAGLYDSTARAYRTTTVSYNGTTYRYVALDATKITAQNQTVTYGVQDVSQAKGVVTKSECTIELFVSNLSSPASDLGYVMWKSGNTQCSLLISASVGSQGMEVKNVSSALKLASARSMMSAPLSLSALNTSLAMGVVVDPASNPYCKLTDFSVTSTGINGKVEVGKETNGVETKGALGTNARAVLMGAKDLSGVFVEIGSVPVDDSGSFQFYLGSNQYQFFRVRIDIIDVVD